MKLQYLGHSAFRLISETGTTFVTDPFDEKMLGYAFPHVKADVVTLSHDHGDHSCYLAVGGAPFVIDVATALAADDVAVESFECFHDDVQGKKRGKNLVFTFLVDGIKVAHMGDVGELSEKVAQKLAGTNVLLVPVGGKYTVDALGAKWYVDRIKPQVVIPMHYQTAQGGVGVSGVQDFLQLFDNCDVQSFDGDYLVFDDVPQNESTKVIVMKNYVDD